MFWITLNFRWWAWLISIHPFIAFVYSVLKILTILRRTFAKDEIVILQFQKLNHIILVFLGVKAQLPEKMLLVTGIEKTMLFEWKNSRLILFFSPIFHSSWKNCKFNLLGRRILNQKNKNIIKREKFNSTYY